MSIYWSVIKLFTLSCLYFGYCFFDIFTYKSFCGSRMSGSSDPNDRALRVEEQERGEGDPRPIYGPDYGERPKAPTLII